MGYLRVLQAPPVVWFTDYGTAAAAFAAGALLMRVLAPGPVFSCPNGANSLPCRIGASRAQRSWSMKQDETQSCTV